MQESLLYKVVEPAHWVGLMKSDDLLDYLRVSSWDGQPLDFLPIIKNISIYSSNTVWVVLNINTHFSLCRTIC